MALRIIVIGGVAGGMSAATRARRMNEAASIIVLEKGGFISFANCGLPYYIAGRIKSQDSLLVTTPEKVRQRYNIDARVHHEVLRIDRASRSVHGIDHSTEQPFQFPYDKLILAPGALPIVPNIPHVNAPNVFLLRSMEDTLAVQNWIERHSPRRVAIVGAGFIGLEMAEAMRLRGAEVTLVEKAPTVLPPLDPELSPWLEKELTRHEIRLITGAGLKLLHESAGRVNQAELDNGQRVDADMVLLSIGVRPNTELARSAGLAIGPTGAIATDEFHRTSDLDIYSVGDAAEVIHAVTGKPVRIPLAGPANRHGRAAGEHAATGNAPPAGPVLGTAVVGVFDMTAAITGLGEAAAKAAGFDVDTAYIHAAHHAGYYPGAEPMHIKLIYDRPTARILGAQAVGGAGVDKRIDVIATAIHFKATIDDLAQLDLAYAPQYGSAKDPVHIAAFVAQNQQRQLTRACTPGPTGEDLLLDVRTPKEYAAGTVSGAVNVPVDELRARASQFEKNRPITLFCQAGLRGYVAQRILQQLGYAVRNIKGGYTTIMNWRK